MLAAAVLVGVLHNPSAGADPEASVGAAEKALAEASEHTRQVEGRLFQLEADLASAGGELAGIAEGESKVVDLLVSTEAEVREYVVAAYVNGGEPPRQALGVATDDLAEMAWRDEVLSTAASERRRDFTLLGELRDAVGVEHAELASRAEELQAELADVRNDLIQASAHEREAEDALDRARRAALQQRELAEAEARRARQQAGQVAAGGGGATSGPMPGPGSSGIAGDPTARELAVLAKIRRCESRGNYAIVSSTGKYRGAYQFDRRTWAGVGGSGDPAAAPPHEQDYRALVLYRSRGGRPWPNCS